MLKYTLYVNNYYINYNFLFHKNSDKCYNTNTTSYYEGALPDINV